MRTPTRPLLICALSASALLAQQNLTVTGSQCNASQQAVNSITTSGACTATGGTSVKFEAGGIIKLEPGFSATAGTASPAFDAVVVPQAVAPALATPASGAGGPALTPQTFIITLTDTLGAADINSFQLSFGGTGAQPGICSLSYSGGVLGLWSNAGSQLYTTPPLQNSQCIIGNSTTTPAGNTLTFTVSIDFLTSFQGSQELYAIGVSSSGDYHPWVDLGSWNVTAPTTQTRIFSSPGTYTWTAPTGVTSVQAEAWGPGGNGANGAYFTPLYISGGGGGGGAYAKKSSVSVTPGQQYSIVVGAAGSSTKTSFSGTAVVADFGLNGAQATTNMSPDIGGPGGQAANSTGDVKQPGASGGNAGSPYGGYGGGGGNGGAGGLGGQGSPNGNGYPGSSPGGGGGGAAVGAVQYYGGPGGNGQLVLTYGGPSTTTYSITGIVTSYYTGLRGVTIALTGSQSATVTTDAYGNFWFFNLPAGGTYTVTASMSGYSLSAPQTFANLSADQYAYFTAIPTTTYYTLTTTVTTPNWGTISPSCPAGCSYSSGTQVAITAVPNSGYQLASFSGVDSVVGSTGYVTMNSNRNVTATFTPQAPTTVSIYPDVVAVAPGGTQQFNANVQVTWSVTYGPGTVSASGLYSAPADASPGAGVSVQASASIGSALARFSLLHGGLAVSNVQVPSEYLTTTGVTVTWVTTTNATSQILWGTSSAYGNSTTLDGTLTKNHQQYLTGLSASTTYHFQVRSTDQPGNTAIGPDATFTTPAVPPSVPVDFQNCVRSDAPLCTLNPGTYAVQSATDVINVNRYGLTITGGASDRTQTRIVRGPGLGFPNPLLLVSVTSPTDGTTLSMAQAGKSQGIVIQNLTFCGGGNTYPYNDLVHSPNATPAAMSPSTPGASPCWDQHPSRSPCSYAGTCADLAVDSVAADLSVPGAVPLTPFTYTYSGSYALEVNNVDLEDAPGHALTLYATSGNPGSPKRWVNDVHIHNSAVNYSAVTGILYGFNHATYDSKFCDDYDKRSPNRRPFYNDPDLVSPRNILIDGNTFFYNNTSPVAGDARWFGLKNNYFYANYISPQSGNYGGGTVAFFLCSDQVEISGNTFIGPSETTPLPAVAGQQLLPFCQTPGLELYSRNLNVHDNTISGQSLDAIAADSLYQGTFQNNHLLQDNGWNVVNPKGANSCLPNPAPSAAFKIGTAASPVIEAKGGCEAVPRDMNGVTVRGNDSNPIDVFHNNLSITTGPAYQAYGVFLEQYGIKSTSKLYGATIDSNNFGGAYPLHNTLYQIYLDYFAGVYGYQGPLNSNSGPNPREGSVLYLPPENDYPELLPVDAVCASSSTGSACTCNPQQQQNCVCSSPTSACISSQSALWPTPPRCPDRKDSNGNLLQPLPPGSMLGSSRATFKFSGSDKSGAANIAGIYGIFSVGGSDADGSSGPSIDPTGKAPDQGMCNFAYDPVNNLVYLGDGNGGWLAPSTLGSGSDLSTPGGCIIHVSTSSVGTGSGQAAPQTYVVDLFLDVTLPSTPKNKYHIYSYTENSQGQFDRAPDGKTDAIWKYSGYWWNAQTVQ